MNIVEISEKFPTELDAVKYFEEKRWGEKPMCAYCKSTNLSSRGKDENKFISYFSLEICVCVYIYISYD